MDARNLAIITGSGKHSHTSTTPAGMKTVVKNLLIQLGLPCEAGTNPGRLQIPYDALYKYVQQEQHSSILSTFLHEASLRYLILFGGVSGLCAAMYVIPKLLIEV